MGNSRPAFNDHGLVVLNRIALTKKRKEPNRTSTAQLPGLASLRVPGESLRVSKYSVQGELQQPQRHPINGAHQLPQRHRLLPGSLQILPTVICLSRSLKSGNQVSFQLTRSDVLHTTQRRNWSAGRKRTNRLPLF